MKQKISSVTVKPVPFKVGDIIITKKPYSLLYHGSIAVGTRLRVAGYYWGDGQEHDDLPPNGFFVEHTVGVIAPYAFKCWNGYFELARPKISLLEYLKT